VQVECMNTVLKAPGTKRLKQRYDKLLYRFAFNFNLRRYTEVSLTTDYSVKGTADLIAVSYQHMARDMVAGDRILMADGRGLDSA